MVDLYELTIVNFVVIDLNFMRHQPANKLKMVVFSRLHQSMITILSLCTTYRAVMNYREEISAHAQNNKCTVQVQTCCRASCEWQPSLSRCLNSYLLSVQSYVNLQKILRSSSEFKKKLIQNITFS